MGPRHFTVYEDSVFRHYVQFGPPGVDLPTFEHILSQWDKKSKKFVFTDRNDGEEIACSFNLEEGLFTTIFLFDIHKESEDAPPGEVPPPEAHRIDKALKAEINEGEKVSPPAKELLTCTETGTQREGTGREITPAVDVPSVGHDTETQTCIDTLWEDTGMEINQSENVPPPAIETSTDDEDAPIVFSRALNKRKRGVRGAREKVATAAPLKRKRCKRAVKPSKWVVTPYTEGKKKKEKDNIGDKAIIEVAGEEEEQVQKNVAELAPTRLQSDPHSIWEKHMSSPMSSEEEMYRNKLNEGIPFPGGFNIKFLDDNDTFVHNYKVSTDVAALLTEEEKKTLNHFCICRCNK
ncbi:uncharacterized protein A4U43_C07F2580 [Asparagus officinalis]|uniref:Uncharacterized protein n=1 Tax=Asparagus officinalis TaxID=4686 RepID=A0A5P1EE07_ASPOF|nr:uncharacterized protein A4U43_C07F2580 [Asparagus officinalis]